MEIIKSPNLQNSQVDRMTESEIVEAFQKLPSKPQEMAKESFEEHEYRIKIVSAYNKLPEELKQK